MEGWIILISRQGENKAMLFGITIHRINPGDKQFLVPSREENLAIPGYRVASPWVRR
jgi:hypothetical protein